MSKTIIVGGGLMGSATAWQLARQGELVILLERQDSIYTSGSSKGEARISRSLGPVDDIYAYLQIRGIQETQQLIDFLNEYEPDQHAMEDIYTTSPVTYLFYPESSDEIAVFNLDKPDTLIDGDADSLVVAMTTDEVRKKMNLDVPDSVKAIREYRKYSGTMNPGELIRKLHLAIRYAGGEVRYNQQLTKLERHDKGYALTLNATEHLQADRLVAAAGPYNGALLNEVSPIFEELITPKRLFLAFLKIQPDVYQSLSEERKQTIRDGYPVIKLHSELFYSMIEKVDTDGIPILKVGGHFKRTPVQSLDEVWQQPLTKDEISWSIDETLDYLQMNQLDIQREDLEYHSGYSCVYSLTASEVPLVTNLVMPDGSLDSNGVLVGGMSGVGAKGTMTYGHMAAGLLLGQQVSSDRMYELTKKALGNERLRTN